MDGVSNYAALGSLGIAPDVTRLLSGSRTAAAAGAFASKGAASAPNDAPSTGVDSAPAARHFQELLGAMLVKEMRGTLPEGFFGGGAAGDVYGGWLDEHVGASLASRDALHLESVVRESLDRKARQTETKS
jgi:Rod binding domain-containing protein